MSLFTKDFELTGFNKLEKKLATIEKKVAKKNSTQGNKRSHEKS